jgi:peptidoglycan/xylan/chitin deacetylase (PgdA/CDA1 family)
MTNVIALGYHGVSARWPSSLAVVPEQLRRQVAYLLERGHRPVTVTEAARLGAGERLVVITFDDALSSVYRLAFPILQELGAVATVYAPSVPILSGAPMAWPEVRDHLATEHAAELDGMTVAQLGAVAAAGWEVGSHTRTHPWLPRLDDESLRDELVRSRAELREALGLPITSLAYPFGAHDDRVVAATRVAGYDTAVTLPHRLRAWPPAGADIDERLRLARIGIYLADDMTRFRVKVAAPMRLLRQSPLWDAMIRARARVATR